MSLNGYYNNKQFDDFLKSCNSYLLNLSKTEPFKTNRRTVGGQFSGLIRQMASLEVDNLVA